MESKDIKRILKHYAYRNIPLRYDDAHALGLHALAGCRGDSLAQRQSTAVFCALNNAATYGWKKNGHADCGDAPESASEQIAGIAAAVYVHDIGESPAGFLEPKVPYAMDNCGMGGDMIVTANVSTLAALIASAAGIPMCKHGSPANADEGRHGSSDFITQTLGIRTDVPKNRMEQCVEQHAFGYTEALDERYKTIHSQTHRFAFLPHMNDIIGPATNPLASHVHTRRMFGVNHLITPYVVADAFRILNAKCIMRLEHGLFVRGFVDATSSIGMDEVSICAGGTSVVELKDGVLTEYHLRAEDFGLDPVPVEAISPPPGMSKGEFSKAILYGEIDGPPLQMVLVNAAMLFYLAGYSTNLRACYQMAAEVFYSGAAAYKAEEVRSFLAQ